MILQMDSAKSGRNCRFSSPVLTTFLFFTLIFSGLQAQNTTIPKPEEVIGFKVGSDFHLATYEQSIEYFKKLDAASDLVEMRETGKTSEGRTWYYVLISSKANLDKVEHYKEISKALAHPKGITKELAKQLSTEGKAIVDLSGGLHASEVAGAQHIITLADQIIREADTPKFKAILDNVILVLWPSLNPDGQDIIANWYMGNVGTPYETARTPWLYQKYVGHDNNRDAYMLNMLESRVVGRTWREWEPNIIHVHHQSSPFPTRIWLPPFAEPVATQTPPLMAREVNMIGMAMARDLESEGLPGAVHMGQGFDAWYPGYIDYLPMMQNIPSFWTETALYRYATPYFYTLSDFPKDRRDLRVESLYSSPWKGGWWRLADAMQYMQVASVAVLDYAAKYKETLLFNKYQSGINTIEKYTNEPPYAYIVPQKQRDPVRPVELLKRLAFNGIQISQLEKPMEYSGVTYPKGTWVVPMDQEFAEMARQVLDVQVYPDLRESPDGPLEQPYDAAGWTLPFQMEVDVVTGMVPLSDDFRNALKPVEGTPLETTDDENKDMSKADFAPGAGFDTDKIAAGIKPLPGTLRGSGSTLWLDPAENNSFRVIAEAMNSGFSVVYDAKTKKYGIQGASRGKMQQWVNDYAINGVLGSGSGTSKVKTRIGVYRPWTASMDMGWTRWLLDNFGFGYASIRNSDFMLDNLKDRFDVIVMASEWPGSIERGLEPGSAPPQYAGGLGELGARNLNSFVKEGGTLVTLNRSSDFAIQALHLPVKNVVDHVDRAKFFTGGSIMQVETNPSHPVMAGMTDKANVFVYGSPIFSTEEGFEGEVLAKYQAQGSPLMSGYLVGESFMNGNAAALDVKHGNGHVLLFGFQPQWRGQPMGTYRTLFNALLYADQLPQVKRDIPVGWESVKGKATAPK
ncbi:M14 metallopeptidase family protein [Allomuricauda sp. M10]|uniref:M14 family metallopeptidase n=1 Tax=Allomuricauda sp. M10 TaxID=2683292 RepID=UPI001D1813E6|nr:M14 metallopeptidase family protein [Muricauda sp. M10]